MASFKLHSDVREVSASTGTGNMVLAGAATAYFRFQDFYSNGDTFFYSIKHETANEREIGIGTYNSGSNSISRTTVIQSSNSDALVSFSAGNKDVAVVPIGPSDLTDVQNAEYLALFSILPIESAGRLSLSAGVAMTQSDIAAAATIYLVIIKGNRSPVYDGVKSVSRKYVADISLALDSNSGHTGYHQSGKLFDVYEYWDATNLVMKLGTSPAWTNDTTRANAYEWFEGRPVNTASIPLRFGTGAGDTVSVAAKMANLRGSFYATANGQTDDSRLNRCLSDALRPESKVIRVIETDDSWSYTSTTVRQVNADATNQARVVNCLPGRMTAAVSANYASSASVAAVYGGIGLDGVTPASLISIAAGTATGENNSNMTSYYAGDVGVGTHTLVWLEGGGTGVTMYGDNGGLQNRQQGVVGAHPC